MARGFTIQTDYGDISVSAADAPAFIELTEKMLNKKVIDCKRAHDDVPGPACL